MAFDFNVVNWTFQLIEWFNKHVPDIKVALQAVKEVENGKALHDALTDALALYNASLSKQGE